MKNIIHLGETSFIPVIITLLMLASCKDAKPQSDIYFKDKEAEARYLVEQEDSKQFYLATIKLCLDEDYNASFGTYRESNEYIRDKNCCIQVVPQPYISPMEYYYYRFEGDREIYDNQKNPFKIKKIRKRQEKKNEQLKNKALKVDTESLNFHYYDGWKVTRYDFSQEKLEIIGGFGSLLTHTGVVGPSIEIESLSRNKFFIDMSIKEAEKLFEYFDEINKKNGFGVKTLPSSINTKLTYSVKKPKEHWRSTFAVKIKKLEFFKPNGWSDKIGELNF